MGSRRMLALLLAFVGGAAHAQTASRLLVFSGQNPASYRHDAIDYGLRLMKILAPMGGFEFDTTSNPALITDANLAKYKAIFMNNNCKHSSLFNPAQREALQKFIRQGGGWSGIHCAGAQVLDWPWYQQLVGAVHLQHTPGSVSGVLKVEDRTHGSMKHFTSNTWNIAKEELYYFRNTPVPSWRPNPTLPKVNVLLSFQSWGNGNTQPDGNKGDSSHMGGLAWYHEFDGGRSWYTALGHEQDLFTKDSLYIKHLLGGLKYVLRLDGSTGLRRIAFDGHADAKGHGRMALIGSHAYRFFDIQGNRLRESDPGCACRSAPYRLSIGVPAD